MCTSYSNNMIEKYSNVYHKIIGVIHSELKTFKLKPIEPISAQPPPYTKDCLLVVQHEHKKVRTRN